MTVETPFVLSAPNLSLKITCSGLGGEKPEITGGNTGQAESLNFESCSEIEPKNCRLKTPTITTEPIVATVTAGGSPDDNTLFMPSSGRVLATLDFGSHIGTCDIAGEQPLEGKVKLKASTLQEELASQPIEAMGSTENNSLEVDGNKAFLIGGKALLKLANGKKLKAAPELEVISIGGALIFNFATGKFELKFAANETVRFEIWNASAVEFTLEKKEIKPNENNYKFVAPAKNECKLPEKLKALKGNICFLAIKFQNKVENGTLKLE